MKKLAKNNYYGEQQSVMLSSEPDFFDVSGANLGQLLERLNNNITAKKPITIWGMERQREKIVLDTERQNLLVEDIRSLESLSFAYCELQVTKAFSLKYMEYLLAGRIEIARHTLELQKITNKNAITKLENDRLIDNNRVLESDQKLEKMRAETERIIAESDNINADSLRKWQTGRFIEKFVNSLDVNQLSEFNQMIIATKILGVGDIKDTVEAVWKNRVSDFMEQQLKAETEKKIAEADGIRADVDMKKIKNEEMKKKTNGEK